jgi:fructoselysine 6-phosphate deglycase
MTTTTHPDIDAVLDLLRVRTIRHVFLVACGGSLSIMYPGKYFLDRFAPDLSSDLYNADEFVCRDPRRLGPDALVLVCSQTGTTRETVRAAEHARSAGAFVVAMSLDPGSPLAAAAHAAIRYEASYTTGVPIDAANSNYAALYLVLAGLVHIVEGTDLLPKLVPSLSRLQSTIDSAKTRLHGRLSAFAPRFKDCSAIYTVASGPVYGAAYSYAICVLMEMQWYDSQAIHSNEFFHGPFEVVDRDSSFIVMVGLDETRPLVERVERFLLRFGSQERILVLDARELDTEGLHPDIAPYLVPLIFFDVLWPFAYQLAALRGQTMLEGRRYMKKVTDY